MSGSDSPEAQVARWHSQGMEVQFAFVRPDSPVAGKLLDLIDFTPAAGQVWRAIDPDSAETRDDLALQDQLGDARFDLATFLVKSVWTGVRSNDAEFSEIVERVRIESIRYQRDMMMVPPEGKHVLDETRKEVSKLFGDDPEENFRLRVAA